VKVIIVPILLLPRIYLFFQYDIVGT